ncbi:MAG: DUF3467 domain-containing protein [Candidatus Moranbacteria bacterium]|nr:DUF3467 domain-containing protein [Candidatus Moranbacteria bacterium]
MSNQKQQKINIKFSDEKLSGQYSNAMQILHTKEEFALDFLNILPPTGVLNSRIIVSPGHLKRMLGAIKENLDKYESQFGKIQESKSPQPGKIGFEDRG